MGTELKPVIRNGAYHLNGMVLPRVTRVLDVLAKPGLEAWKHRIGLEEARRISETSAQLGTLVHRICEDINRGLTPAVSDDLAPFSDTYLGWIRESVRETVLVEHFVWHGQHLYAGTVDLVAELRDGRRMLIDIKTSNSLDGTYRLQTAAYADALEDRGEPVDGRLIVNLPSRQPGVIKIVEYDDYERDLKAWRAVLRLYRWNTRHANDWRKH